MIDEVVGQPADIEWHAEEHVARSIRALFRGRGAIVWVLIDRCGAKRRLWTMPAGSDPLDLAVGTWTDQ